MEYSRDTRIIDLTLGEFEDWLTSKGFVSCPQEKVNSRNLVYGYAGIMELFNCSESKAYRLRMGLLKEAVLQDAEGGSIIVDVDKAMQLMKQKCANLK